MVCVFSLVAVSVCLSLCLSVCLCVCLFVSVSVSDTHTQTISLSLSLSLLVICAGGCGRVYGPPRTGLFPDHAHLPALALLPTHYCALVCGAGGDSRVPAFCCRHLNTTYNSLPHPPLQFTLSCHSCCPLIFFSFLKPCSRACACAYAPAHSTDPGDGQVGLGIHGRAQPKRAVSAGEC